MAENFRADNVEMRPKGPRVSLFDRDDINLRFYSLRFDSQEIQLPSISHINSNFRKEEIV